MSDEIDDQIRAAATAHEALADADYFAALPARVLARLAATSRDDAHAVASEVSMMSDTSNSNDPGRGAAPPPTTGTTGPTGGDRTEDSGLHDMKALAQTAKRRISRRSSQHDAYDESLLSSSQSGLRAVALPAPAQLVSLPTLPAVGAADVAAVTPIGAAPARRNRTMLFVAVGGALAAAAAAVFILSGSGTKATSDEGAAQVAVRAEGAPAAGSAAAAPAGIAAGSAAAAQDQVAALTTTDPATAVPVAPPAPAAVTGSGSAAEPESAAKGDSRAADKGSDKAAAKVERAGAGTGAPGAGADKTGAGGKKPGGDKAVAGADKGGGDKAGGDKAGGGAAAGGGGGEKSIEDLLNDASGGAQKPKGESGGGEVKPEKTGLDGKDIKAGMGAVKGTAQACFDQHGVAGLVKVKAVVDPSGKVTKADATGEFAGTPTGACVAAAVKGASFASWTGGPMTISYGFTLQE